jgi:hypothetical protein
VIRSKGVDSGRKADREMVFRSNTRVAYASPHRQANACAVRGVTSARSIGYGKREPFSQSNQESSGVVHTLSVIVMVGR